MEGFVIKQELIYNWEENMIYRLSMEFTVDKKQKINYLEGFLKNMQNIIRILINFD